MNRAERAVHMIREDISHKRVLEVACGCAVFSIAASAMAEQVFCIDLESFRLDKGLKDCPNVTFQRMDATALEYGDGSFDTVVIYNAAAHLESILPQVLFQCRRVVRREGGQGVYRCPHRRK